MKQVDARRLVVVDEGGSNLALTPLYARAPKGQRAHGSVPRNRGKNTTLLGSLPLAGIGASMIIEGSVNAAAFEAYVEHILVPSLCAGQIVVMDASRARTKECGCVSSSRHVAVNCSTCQRILLITLPLKRPNPALKAFLRRVGARTHEALQEAIGQALETVTAQDALGWFAHCGYWPAQASSL